MNEKSYSYKKCCNRDREHGLWNLKTLVQVLNLLLTACVVLSLCLDLFVPRSSLMQIGIIIFSYY